MNKIVLLLFLTNMLVAVGCSGVNVKITYVDVDLETNTGDNAISPDETKIDSITDFEADGELQAEVTP